MDRGKVEGFLDRFVGFASGTTTIALLAVAEKVGMTEWLGEHEAGSAEEIAFGAGLEERYVREIASALAAAGVLEYEPETRIFTLPPEHAVFLASELSPYFMGGWLDMLPSVMRQIEGVAQATVHGGGVGFEEFGAGLIRGIDRGNAPSQRVFLTARWLPAINGLVERLEAGIRVADVGCGAGTAALLMAEAFPKSNVVGFDISDESLAIARSRAEHVPNLTYENYGAKEIPLDPGFGLVTTFDVIHDLPDPMGALTRIRESLDVDGVYLMMEPNSSSSLENNLDDRGALLYGVSAMHCMTQSLAKGGEGLGAAWGAEMAEDYCKSAGFSSFERLDGITNKFSAFYEVRP